MTLEFKTEVGVGEMYLSVICTGGKSQEKMESLCGDVGTVLNSRDIT